MITGCVSGIGNETARALRATGIDLVLCGRDIEALERIQTNLLRESDVGCIHVVYMDLASLETVPTAVERISELVDRLDILICNAGTDRTQDIRTCHWSRLTEIRRCDDDARECHD